MDFAIGFLTFGTLGFVAAFAYISERVAEKQAKAGGPKSLLSKDGAAEYLARKTRSA
ncbi:MAG: hypothetical protein U0934_00010 [Pseudotabrizicola sp.]|uniref:hypothetical protein n=1 Tax=Pseudotabrizicola sp. TaxID=2939647 RepID=UPI002732157E|nr:hypothetical protein [Pseudotabrizicola sp.]MDP2079342.1 hypothetical protein [Pseudotabrizicola sp.]MDZ7572325.1 hypothetical protein [Pseudotabrizicola sp.]